MKEQKFHINLKGEIGPCRAQEGGRGCPFGSPEEHYPTREQAEQALRTRHGETTISRSRNKLALSPKLEDQEFIAFTGSEKEKLYLARNPHLRPSVAVTLAQKGSKRVRSVLETNPALNPQTLRETQKQRAIAATSLKDFQELTPGELYAFYKNHFHKSLPRDGRVTFYSRVSNDATVAYALEQLEGKKEESPQGALFELEPKPTPDHSREIDAYLVYTLSRSNGVSPQFTEKLFKEHPALHGSIAAETQAFKDGKLKVSSLEVKSLNPSTPYTREQLNTYVELLKKANRSGPEVAWALRRTDLSPTQRRSLSLAYPERAFESESTPQELKDEIADKFPNLPEVRRKNLQGRYARKDFLLSQEVKAANRSGTFHEITGKVDLEKARKLNLSKEDLELIVGHPLQSDGTFKTFYDSGD